MPLVPKRSDVGFMRALVWVRHPLFYHRGSSNRRCLWSLSEPLSQLPSYAFQWLAMPTLKEILFLVHSS